MCWADQKHAWALQIPGHREVERGDLDHTPAAHPLVLPQHFTGTLDNWDPAVADTFASGREVILFDNAGIGRSTGKVRETVQGMAAHTLAFLDALGLEYVDLLGFSLGGMVAQQIALARPSLVRKMLLVGTAPEGGEEIMRMEKPELKQIFTSNLPASQRLMKLFFAPSASSQAAGEAFIARLAQRNQDREPLSGPGVAKAQIAAFRAWEAFSGERFAKLRKIGQPCLVENGVFDITRLVTALAGAILEGHQRAVLTAKTGWLLFLAEAEPNGAIRSRC